MKKLIQFFVLGVLSLLVKSRYRVKVRGLEKLEGNGYLILPNHVSILDAAILQAVTWKRFQARPFVADRFFFIPYLKWLFDLIGAIPAPDFTVGKNTFKIFELRSRYETIISFLEKGQNILFYPAGHLKSSGIEKLGGASGLHAILLRKPDTKMLMVRLNGLWGSRFSPAPHGRTPDLKKEILFSMRALLKSGLIFLPKREVEIEFSEIEFPSLPTKEELNSTLEKWYNKPFQDKGEAFRPLPYTLRKNEPLLEEIPLYPSFKGEPESDLEREICSLIKEATGKNVLRDTYLSQELRLDSLDISELYHFLEEKYEMTHLYSPEIMTPAHIAKEIEGRWRSRRKENFFQKEDVAFKKLFSQKRIFPKFKVTNPVEILFFLERSPLKYAALDEVHGLVGPKWLAERVRKGLLRLKGDPRKEIPLLIPSSLEGSLAILSVSLANKKPLFISPEEVTEASYPIYSSKVILREWHGWEIKNFTNQIEDLFIGEDKKYTPSPYHFDGFSQEEGEEKILTGRGKEKMEKILSYLARGIPFVSSSCNRFNESWAKRFGGVS